MAKRTRRSGDKPTGGDSPKANPIRKPVRARRARRSDPRSGPGHRENLRAEKPAGFLCRLRDSPPDLRSPDAYVNLRGWIGSVARIAGQVHPPVAAAADDEAGRKTWSEERHQDEQTMPAAVWWLGLLHRALIQGQDTGDDAGRAVAIFTEWCVWRAIPAGEPEPPRRGFVDPDYVDLDDPSGPRGALVVTAKAFEAVRVTGGLVRRDDPKGRVAPVYRLTFPALLKYTQRALRALIDHLPTSAPVPGMVAGAVDTSPWRPHDAITRLRTAEQHLQESEDAELAEFGAMIAPIHSSECGLPRDPDKQAKAAIVLNAAWTEYSGSLDAIHRADVGWAHGLYDAALLAAELVAGVELGYGLVEQTLLAIAEGEPEHDQGPIPTLVGRPPRDKVRGDLRTIREHISRAAASFDPRAAPIVATYAEPMAAATAALFGDELEKPDPDTKRIESMSQEVVSRADKLLDLLAHVHEWRDAARPAVESALPDGVRRETHADRSDDHRHRDKTPPPAAPKADRARLVAIATEIRGLVALNTSPADRRDLGGRLVAETLRAGAFQGADRVGWRTAIEARLDLPLLEGKLHPYISAWAELSFRVRRAKGLPTDVPDPEATFSDDCRLIADALEEEAAGRPAGAPPETTQGVWLTVTDAATLLQKYVDNLSLKKAKARVSAAAGRKEFTTNGKVRLERRIERNSFSTWLLKQNEKNLAKDDTSIVAGRMNNPTTATPGW